MFWKNNILNDCIVSVSLVWDIEMINCKKVTLLPSYEQEVKANPHNYDAWFDYLRLLESDGDVDQVREVYERAIANVPPSKVSTAIVTSLTTCNFTHSETKCTKNEVLIY